jgi:hypothetical protein
MQQWALLKALPQWTPDGELYSVTDDGRDTVLADARRLRDYLDATAGDTTAAGGNARREAFGIVGNPSLSRVNWIRFVVIVDDQLPATHRSAGQLWVDDLRLDGVRNGWGSAARTSLQLDFADVMTLSGDVNYRDGDFATMNSEGNSPKPSPAEAASMLQYRSDLKFQLNRFLRDDWKFSIPLGVSYSAGVERPFLKPRSDLELSHDDYGDFADDALSLDSALQVSDTTSEATLRRGLESKGWQKWSESRTFSLSFRKDYVKSKSLPKELLGQALLERPELSWRWTERNSRSALAIDTTSEYRTEVRYNLGQLGRQNRRFFNPWPETWDLTLVDFTFSRIRSQQRDPERVGFSEEPVTDYTLDLNHATKINWNLFSFLNLAYSLDLNRDMREERDAFGRENLLSDQSPGGMLAWKKLTAFDNTDWRQVYERDSVGESCDTLRSPTLTTNPADSVIITCGPVYRDTITSAQRAGLGGDYGLLSHERDRRQNFKIGLQPNLFEFLETRANFTADFTQQRQLPEEWDPWDPMQIDKDYWTVGRTAGFEFRPRLKPQKLFPKWKSWNEALKKIQLTGIEANWSAEVSEQGEDFRLPYLHDSLKVTPLDWWLWGLGLGDGDPDHVTRNPWDIITGDGLKSSPWDRDGFAEYLLQNPDSLVFQDQFRQTVTREAGASTRWVIPWHKMRASVQTKWKHQFVLFRAYPLQEEESWSWPWWSASLQVPDVQSIWAWSRKALRSLTLDTRFTYSLERVIKPYQNVEDFIGTKYQFDPLFKFDALTAKRRIKLTNGFTTIYETGWRRPKIDPFDGRITQEINRHRPYYPPAWVYTDLTLEDTWTFRDRFELSYDLPTNRGMQIMKWYFKFKNPIKLGFATDFERVLERRYDYLTPNDGTFWPTDTTGVAPAPAIGERVYSYTDPITGEVSVVYQPDFTADGAPDAEKTRPRDSWLVTVRPSAGYRFTDKIQGDAWIEYSWYSSTLAQADESTKEQTLAYEVRVQINF